MAAYAAIIPRLAIDVSVLQALLASAVKPKYRAAFLTVDPIVHVLSQWLALCRSFLMFVSMEAVNNPIMHVLTADARMTLADGNVCVKTVLCLLTKDACQNPSAMAFGERARRRVYMPPPSTAFQLLCQENLTARVHRTGRGLSVKPTLTDVQRIRHVSMVVRVYYTAGIPIPLANVCALPDTTERSANMPCLIPAVIIICAVPTAFAPRSTGPSLFANANQATSEKSATK
jgi:hypothetical protein